MINHKNSSESNTDKKSKLLTSDYYEYYIMIVGIFGQSMHYIQAYKVFSTQSAEDISLLSYLICLFVLMVPSS